MVRKDIEATIAQHFLCPDSYVTPDGRHILKGEDWKAQKLKVWTKSFGKCQYKGSTYGYCARSIADIHHKIKRSKKRDDREENLIGLCNPHHKMMHPEKQPKWSAKS